MSSRSPEFSNVLAHWSRLQSHSPIYSFLLSSIEITAVTHSSVTAHLKVSVNHLNSKRTLHGSVSACIVDWVGGLAIASTGLDNTGVSTDLHTIYLSTAKEGDMLEIIGHANKVGKTMAFTTVHINRVGEDGQSVPVAYGTHTKFVKL